ncbi:MAG: manganese transporter, partial [Mycobacterium sp.]|nr:manganese transporter [Mycobacterium sp.]
KPLVPDSLSRVLARADRSTWRMPPLALLEPVTWSTGTRLGMVALRGYLVAGAILLVVKAIQLGSA